MSLNRLKKDLLSGIGYTALAKYIGIAFSLITVSILARILSPADFGVVSIAMIFLSFFSTLTITGISPAIIQNNSLSESDINGLYAFSFYLAGLLAVCLCLTAPCWGVFYENTTLTYILLLSSLSVFFSIINIVPNALALKSKDFKFIALRTMLIQIITGGISIISAWAGMGVYSLLFLPILGSIGVFGLTVRKYRLPFQCHFQIATLAKISHFSSYQILFNINNLLYRNIDKLLVGYFWTPSALGYYDKAYHLILLPVDNIANVITPVLHPVLAEYQTDIDFIFDNHLKIVTLLAYIGFFAGGVSFGCAREIILIVFGMQWESAIFYFRLFSLIVGILVVQSAVGAIFQATNNTKGMFKASICALILTTIACLYGIIGKSIYTLIYGVIITYYLTFFCYHYFLFRESLWRFRKFLKTLFLPVALGIIVGTVLVLWDSLFFIQNIFLSGIIKIGLCVPFVVVLLFFFQQKFSFYFNR